MTSDIRKAGKSERATATAMACLLGLFLLFHICAITAFNLPNNLLTPAIGSTLDAYVAPYFAQTWSLFAPDPGKVQLDYRFRYRYRFSNGSFRISSRFRGSEVFAPSLAIEPFHPLEVFRQISYACETIGQDAFVASKLKTDRRFPEVTATSVNVGEECLTRLALSIRNERALVGTAEPPTSIAVQIDFLASETTNVMQHFNNRDKPERVTQLYTTPWIVTTPPAEAIGPLIPERPHGALQ